MVKKLENINLHEYLEDVHEHYAPQTAKRRNAILRRFFRFLQINNDYHVHDLSLQVKDQAPSRDRLREREAIIYAFRHTVKQKKEPRAAKLSVLVQSGS